MGDLIPFRRPKHRKWTRAEDYGKVLPTSRWRGEPPEPPRRSRFAALRPWLLLTLLLGLWQGLEVETLEPLSIFASDPEQVNGPFTRCGPGRGVNCVIDGDTFKLGERTVRVLGIDAPETHPARCPAEAAKGELATAELQRLLSRGPFRMTGRINDMRDQYGRDLRALSRVRFNGTTESIAEQMIASGTVRRYYGAARGTWC
jgi:endonuclease YncB( thermonuclease family)